MGALSPRGFGNLALGFLLSTFFITAVSAASVPGRRSFLQKNPIRVSSSSRTSVISSSRDASYFYPYLRRFIQVPKEWKVTLDEKISLFERVSATDGKKQLFTVTPMIAADCDVQKIQMNYAKRTGEEKELSVEYVRIPGWLGAGFTWVDSSTPGGSRHWCIVPIGNSRVTEVRADDADIVTKVFVEKTMLRQLIEVARRTR